MLSEVYFYEVDYLFTSLLLFDYFTGYFSIFYILTLKIGE